MQARTPHLAAIPCVGDGMTMSLGSDRKAYTIIAVSPADKTLTLQRDKATRTNRDKDTFAPGGFFGHTECPDGQDWQYSADPHGSIIKATWRDELGRYKEAGWRTKSPGGTFAHGRHEHYDYDF